jgi:glucoamylase
LVPGGGAASLVWFTLARGAFHEIFYPRPDVPSIRDFSLIVTDGKKFLSDEQQHARHSLKSLGNGVPAYQLTNICEENRYRIDKTVFAHPRHHAVIQQTRFVSLSGDVGDYHVYAMLAPHLGGEGKDNTAWTADWKGQPMLFAQRESCALALACSVPWKARSVGYAGVSDGRVDLNRYKELRYTYEHAEKGNVSMVGEVDLTANGRDFVLVVAFGADPAEAGHRAHAILLENLEEPKQAYITGWQNYQQSLTPLESVSSDDGKLYRSSTAVMCVHDGKSLAGLVASLATPWGMEPGDTDRLRGGYHLVWPRDLGETAGGLLAAGAREDAVRRLSYLQATQEADGHWPQNMWMTGEPFWTGIQLCETGLPILLLDLLKREGLEPARIEVFWPMARAAAMYILKKGPCTEEDRWEREPGYTPFTLAVIIAALLSAAELAEALDDTNLASALRDTADKWNASIEGWLYVTDTKLAQKVGVEGYYARVLTPDAVGDVEPGQPKVRLRAHAHKVNGILATDMISPDALALVRFGLRRPDDPRMQNTVKAIDAVLKVETPVGPAWRRFNADDYGEMKDGSPFPGHGKGGVGRPWPLLVGERAHFELAAGRVDDARRLLRTFEGFASETGLLPEQIWDADDVPERQLFRGRATGSAMPLVWAHAEYVKLLRSLRDGRVFDMPAQTVKRYL